MESTIDLPAVRAFVEVVRSGGFAAAGRRLGLPRSTLSRQVQRLEEALGVRLLHRTTRQLRPTEAGTAYFHRCAHALDLVESADRVARDAADRPSGTLRVTTSFDFGRDFLAAGLPAFRRAWPEVNLVVELTQRRVDLLAEGFDVAIRGGGPPPDSAGIVAKRLASSGLGLYAAPQYLAARGVPERVADLVAHDCIGFPGTDLVPSPWLAANEWGFLRHCVLEGLGIGGLENSTCAADVRAGRLVRVLPEHGREGGALYVLYAKGPRIAPKVKVFVAFLAELVRGVQ